MTVQPVSPQMPDEALLIERARRRDPDAIRCIMKDNNQRLFRAAWSVLRDHSDAEDTVQEAYLKAFTSIDDFAGQSSLSTWLTRIVVNAALDRRRAAVRRRQALASLDVAILEDQRALRRASEGGYSSPEVQLARADLSRTLKAAVEALPDAYRSVFVLRDVEGMTVCETAAVTSLTESVVKVRLFRARRILREKLDAELGELLADTLSFDGADCEAMTARVLGALDIETKGD